MPSSSAPPPPPAEQKLEEVFVTLREALVNDGTARHSERAVRMLSRALNCSVFDVRCLDDRAGGCTFNEREMPIDAIARVVPKLRHRNATGSGVFIRPCRPFALADDVRPDTLDRMLDNNLSIAAVIETSPGSFQVWIPLAGPLQPVDQAVCVAACDRLVELYDTDPGVAHRDSFGRAPGFRNRKPEHNHDGITPLVVLSNRHSGFRGYDRALLNEARRMVANHPQHLGKRSAGGVRTSNGDTSAIPDYLGPIEVSANGDHAVTFSTIYTDSLFDRWLAGMQAAGYEIPNRSSDPRADRSQRDLDVLRSMHTAGVPQDAARAALKAGSDKAQDRGPSYLHHLIRAAWGEP